VKNYHHKKLSPQKTPDRAEGFSPLVQMKRTVLMAPTVKGIVKVIDKGLSFFQY
jgi:hypothetical protein